MSEPNTLTPALRDKTYRWIAEDADADTRAELQAVLADARDGSPTALSDLNDRMAGPLTFGTAGLRGPVRAGPNGMNTAVVIRTTHGVGSWLREQGHAGGIVVIGRDARHGSPEFAEAAAEVLAAAGFTVRVLRKAAPTPVLAFAVGHLGAVAGIQVTASHNPPADNGYKLYDHTGTQIVPPTDSRIEAAIDAAPASVSIRRSPVATTVGDDLLEAYVSRVAELPSGNQRTLRIAATAMHGVGAKVLREALHRSGFTDVHFVAEQEEPDPDFPTVSFPNPEEPGAADLLLTLAARIDADLAIALDPDADRCALGVRQRDGSWRMLRGDETGVLLGEHILSTIDFTEFPDPLVATTIVSSSMLAEIARAHGARYIETPTGFKWLARAGQGLVYAYEEALGLCVNPSFVRDKDGIAAAILACDLAATLRVSGSDLLDAQDELATRYGVFRTETLVRWVAELAEQDVIMANLRANPPARLVGTEANCTDLLPEIDAVRITTDQLRVIVRPSGTEPKLKAYLQVTEPVTERNGLAEARETAERLLELLRADVNLILHT